MEEARVAHGIGGLRRGVPGDNLPCALGRLGRKGAGGEVVGR